MKIQLNDLLTVYNHEVGRNTKNKRKIYIFEKHKLINIVKLKEELENKEYCMKKYNIFSIYEPKLRIIM